MLELELELLQDDDEADDPDADPDELDEDPAEADEDADELDDISKELQFKIIECHLDSDEEVSF